MNKKDKELRLPKGSILLIIAFTVGIILLCLGGLGSCEDKEGDKKGETDYSEAEKLEIYKSSTGEKVRLICEDVKGISNVKVLLDLEGGYEYVYTGAGKLQCVLSPRVRGIAVVCKGGGLPQNQKIIIDLLSAAFDISSARISVTEGD